MVNFIVLLVNHTKQEKGAFRNHPCTIWANVCLENTWWLLTQSSVSAMNILGYGKIHSCEKTLEEATTIFLPHHHHTYQNHLLSQVQR